MQNRKQRNMEIEKKLKQRRSRSAAISIAILVIVIAAISWVVWDTQSRQWIMNFEGQRIENGDFMVFQTSVGMFIQDDQELLNELAMQDLVRTLTVLHHGNRLNLGLTAEERAQLEFDAANQIMAFGMHFTTPARLAELFGSGPVHQRLAMHYFGDYTPSEADFEAALDEHILEHGEELERFDAVFAVLNTMEDALMVFADERDFLELVSEYCVLYPETGVTEFDAREIAPGLEPDDAAIVLNMETGHRHLIHIPAFSPDDEDEFIVIYMRDRSFPTRDEIAEDFREHFILLNALEQFSDVLDGWIENANYRVNDRALRNL